MNRKTNIPFNKPCSIGSEIQYISKALYSNHISGNGKYTKLCQRNFENTFDFKKALLTTSCTDALEMSAILLNIQAGDEVIMPSFTFVSTANAFVLRGARIVFVDSRSDHPGMDEDLVEELITPKTKAIVVVHYAGVACDMEKIMRLASKYGLYVVEDAAQAIDSYYKNSNGEKLPLGSIGHLATFSFHETKNITAGEGGMLVINDLQFAERAEIIWEKGTNRSAFFRGEVDKYGWVDVGSSYLPSEITAAFLFAQLNHLEKIQKKRLKIWEHYLQQFKANKLESFFGLPFFPDYATNNGHMFYIICSSEEFRRKLINFLKEKGVMAVFHYQSLHTSKFYFDKHDGRELRWSVNYSNTLLRLPFYYDLKFEEIDYIVGTIAEFCRK